MQELWGPFFEVLKVFQGRLVDGVILATPSDLHKNQGVLCAENNIPALIEKPLATTLYDAEALVGSHSKLAYILFLDTIGA